MRFIFNFIFFGILFYIIYLFFPDAFSTLVSWANHAYEFLRDIAMQLYAKFHTMSEKPVTPPAPEHTVQWLQNFF